jgi:hypothetical protein
VNAVAVTVVVTMVATEGVGAVVVIAVIPRLNLVISIFSEKRG